MLQFGALPAFQLGLRLPMARITRSRLARGAFATVIASSLRVLLRDRRYFPCLRQPIHPRGPRFAENRALGLRYGSAEQFTDLFRMQQPHFERLLRWLRTETQLQSSRRCAGLHAAARSTA